MKEPCVLRFFYIPKVLVKWERLTNFAVNFRLDFQKYRLTINKYHEIREFAKAPATANSKS